jgi:hypothetical protein
MVGRASGPLVAGHAGILNIVKRLAKSGPNPSYSFRPDVGFSLGTCYTRPAVMAIERDKAARIDHEKVYEFSR